MQEKTVLITGASRGIGAGMAEIFAAAGYRVVLQYYQSEQAAGALARRLQENGAQVLPVCCDIRDSTQVEEMFRIAERAFGKVDVLVNNAGIAQQKLFTDVTDAEWRDVFAVDVDGAFYCSRRALGSMLHEHAGCIVNVSSMWGQVGASCEVAYSAAKAAVIGLTKALAKEVGPSGIRVNCIAPGVIDTDMNRHLGQETMQALAEDTPLCRIGSVQDVAKTALFLASEDAAFITGQVIGVNGGFVI